jgi:hypothetical protein
VRKIGLIILLLGAVLLIIALTRKPDWGDVLIYENMVREWNRTTETMRYGGIGLIVIGGILSILGGGKKKVE